MMNQALKTLNNSQVQSFDVEYVTDRRWQTVRGFIQSAFPLGEFEFLDIGGGNGLFADRLLNTFHNSRGVLLDNSQYLLNRNLLHKRKLLICETVENILNVFTDRKFDLIFLNWLLHHLVGSSYEESRGNITKALIAARSLLKPGGYISIFENMYDGILVDNLPGQLIYKLTSLQTIAPLMRALGANTAGCGVCFLSKRKWEETILSAGIKIVNYTDDDRWEIPLAHKIFLHVGPVRVGHFWCSPE